MWLDWYRCVNIYLGQSLAMIKVGREEAVVSEFPSTTPLHLTLSRLDEVLNNFRKSRSQGGRMPVRVFLSGAVCPAISFKIAVGVLQFDELEKVALSHAESVMQVSKERLTCRSSLVHPGLVCAVPRNLLAQLSKWSEQHRLRLVSCEPLWASTTRQQIVGRREIKGICLYEPDSVTGVAFLDSHDRHSAITLVDRSTANLQESQLETWKRDLKLNEGSFASFEFGSEKGAIDARLSTAWSCYLRLQ